MKEATNLISTEDISKAVSHYTIGFAKLFDSAGGRDVLPLGSGSLVTVGSTMGILTAAHVVDALPEDGRMEADRDSKHE
jgi:hypothetical protein